MFSLYGSPIRSPAGRPYSSKSTLPSWSNGTRYISIGSTSVRIDMRPKVLLGPVYPVRKNRSVSHALPGPHRRPSIVWSGSVVYVGWFDPMSEYAWSIASVMPDVSLSMPVARA